MDVCYAQKIAKYVQNPEVDVEYMLILTYAYALITGELRQDTNFRENLCLG